MTWTTTVPTEPGVYLWRRRRDSAICAALFELVDDKGLLRVEHVMTTHIQPYCGKTARSLRGLWFGPIGEGE